MPDNFDHYLIKFDGVSPTKHNNQAFGVAKGYGLMEYAYHLMAVDCGIDMMPCELILENGRSHFVTKRFDREANQKYHTLSLCGMAHASFKKIGLFSYEEFLAIARELNLTHKDQVEIYRRMVFNVIARNQDDHTKNFSFLVNDDFQWQLSPAFDIAFSYDPNSDWVAQHCMTINGKRDNFNRKDLLSVSELITKLSNEEAVKIIEEVLEVVSNWKKYSNQVGVFPELAEEINTKTRLYI